MIDVSDPFSSDNLEQDSTPLQSPESPGAILKEARIQAGISLETVADELNLVVAKVEALETDRYEMLASDVFAQGYLRRYSKLVGVDEDKVVECFRQWREATQPPPPENEPRRSPGKPGPMWLIVAAVLGMAVLVAVYLFLEDEEQTAVSPPSERPAPQAPVEPAEPSGSSDDPLWDDEETQVADLSAGWDEFETESLAEFPAGAEPEVEFSSPQQEQYGLAADASSAFNDEEADNAHLSFSFSEECWIEVRDASGQLLRAEVASAGQNISLEGEAPFSVMLGNARGANAYYKGQPVAITTRPGNRTARLTIGP